MGQGQMGETCRKWLLLAPSLERCNPAFEQPMCRVRLGWKHHLCPSGQGRCNCGEELSVLSCSFCVPACETGLQDQSSWTAR